MILIIMIGKVEAGDRGEFLFQSFSNVQFFVCFSKGALLGSIQGS